MYIYIYMCISRERERLYVYIYIHTCNNSSNNMISNIDQIGNINDNMAAQVHPAHRHAGGRGHDGHRQNKG